MTAAALCLLLAAGGAGKSADFLILEDPASLEILSRYEQALTPAERKELLPYAPLKVVAEKTLLGDGITPGMEVEYAGRAYYLPRKGGTDLPPSLRRHRGCRVEDGEEKRAGADLACSRGAAPGGPPAPLRAGEALRPVFTCGARTYVRRGGDRGGYLWCPAGGPWGDPEKAPVVRETDPGRDLQTLLAPRLEEANAAYAEFTRAFNGWAGESRQPPRWDCSFSEGSGDAMRCRLEGGLSAEDLEQSTAVLVDRLRNSLTGKPFEVASGKDEILVSPRAGKNPGRP